MPDKALGGHGYPNLLVICPDEAAFYGTGKLVVALDQEFPGGWYGGALPERGFWGCHTASEKQEKIASFLVERLRRTGSMNPWHPDWAVLPAGQSHQAA